MGIRICGRSVRWQKPIKIYTFVKLSAVLLLATAFVTQSAYSADLARPDSQHHEASPCAAVPCPLLQESGMAVAPASKNTPPHKAQRTAGTHSVSPALALAMALGFRNVQVPVERHEPASARTRNPPPSVKQVSLHTESGGHKKTSMNAAALRLALDD